MCLCAWCLQTVLAVPLGSAAAPMPAPDGASTPLLPRESGAGGSPRQGSGSTPWGTYRSVALSALGPLSVGYVLGYTSPTALALLDSGLLTAPQLSVFEALSPLVRSVPRACSGGWFCLPFLRLHLAHATHAPHHDRAPSRAPSQPASPLTGLAARVR